VFKQSCSTKGYKGALFNLELLNIEKNKFNESLYPYLDMSNNDMGSIRIRKKPNPDLFADNFCVLLFKFKEDPSSDTNIYIQDIVSFGKFNKGFATAAMRALIKYGAKIGAKKITGMISPVDFDHIDRLLAFYRKNNCKLNYSNDAIYPYGFEFDLKKSDTILLNLEKQEMKDRINFLKEENKNKDLLLYEQKEILMKYKNEIDNESRFIKFLKKYL